MATGRVTLELQFPSVKKKIISKHPIYSHLGQWHLQVSLAVFQYTRNYIKIDQRKKATLRSLGIHADDGQVRSRVNPDGLFHYKFWQMVSLTDNFNISYTTRYRFPTIGKVANKSLQNITYLHVWGHREKALLSLKKQTAT